MENEFYIRPSELLGAHVVASLLYYIFIRIRRGNNTQTFSEGMIVLLMPVIGLLFVFGIRFAQWLNSGEERMKTDVYDYHQHSDQLILGEHEQYGDDVIALNDVLTMDDAQQKRLLLTDAVKQNVLSNQSVLRRAIRDDDREVAHYAVSMVTTAVEQIENKLFDTKKKLEKDPENQKILAEYVKNMGEYLKASFLDETSRRAAEEDYAKSLERLIEYSPDDPTIYETKINLELGFDNFDQAELYCQKFADKFTLSELPFISYIKLYQRKHDLEGFHSKITELKKCPIQLTPRALGLIRFWEQGKTSV